MKYHITDTTPFAALTVGQAKELFREIAESYFDNQTQHIPLSPTLNVMEVSELTGYSRATIYKLVHEKKIPFHKPAHGGRKTVFCRDEILKWLKANEIRTNQDETDQLINQIFKKQKP